MKKKQARWKRWEINLSLLIIALVGIALIFNNQIKNQIVKSNSEKYSVAHTTEKEIAENQEKAASFDFEAVVPASTEAVVKAQLSEKQFPTVGGVAVPAVKINLPIFKGVSNESLLFGAGTLDPNQKMGEGNYALASHRALKEDLLFHPLEKVKIGDTIYLTDLTNIYTYQTTIKTIVVPTDIQWIEPVEDEQLVTLITCSDETGTKRIIVQGELQQTTPMKEATDEMLAAFNLESKTY